MLQVVMHKISIEKLCKANPQSYLENPHKLMTDSWKRNQEIGSSTLVVVTLPNNQSKIHYSYVGDSGFVILRRTEDGKITLAHATKPQQKGFNHPGQLGWSINGEHPNVAINGVQEVKNEDIVILGSDGLFDNVDAQRVVYIYLGC